MVPCTGKILTNPELRLKGLNNMPRSIYAPLGGLPQWKRVTEMGRARSRAPTLVKSFSGFTLAT